MSDTFDLLLTEGTVLNPASKVHEELNVGITDGRIAAIQPKLPRENAKKILDVRGCYVTPGLIDFHVHSYWGVNPYGCELDALCRSTGVTTAIDAGSSGPINFKGFKKLVYQPSKTRMIAFIALAQHGVLNDPGELEDLRFADPNAAAATVGESPDVGVGIKVRLHKKGVGQNGR
jgi:dihydroorotase